MVEATAGVLRVSALELTRRGPARSLAVRAAWALGMDRVSELAAAAGCGVATVRRLVEGVPGRGGAHRDPLLLACMRAVGDPRIFALGPGDLTRLPAWGRYRQGRGSGD